MEGIGVSLAKGALSSVAGTLGTMLVEEAALLKGVHEEVVYIKDELDCMSEFLLNAEERPGSGGEALSWVDQVRKLAYDAEDCIEDYTLHLHPSNVDDASTFLRRIARSLKTLKARHRISTQIQMIKTRVRDVSERRSRYFRPGPNSGPTPSISDHALPDLRLPALYVEEAELVGIDGPKNKLLGWLMAKDEPQLTVISVVGMGGLGKTTLARRVYENPMASGGGYFQCRAWITVSQSFEIKGILSSMVSQLFSSAPKEGTTERMEVQAAIEILRHHLKDKRYVVVLDDLWSVPDWEIIMPAFPANTLGSRIMVTTRIESVANRASRRFPPTRVPPHVYTLQPLTHEPSWDLFRRRVFSPPNYVCPPHLNEVSEGIMKKCGGLPLAIVTIGGLLACRSHHEWQNLHNRLGEELDSNPDLGAMKTILNFSYNDLPPQLKRCFLYLSVFPEDYSIDRKRLVRLWVAQGFVSGTTHQPEAEEVSERYFNELINRSLIQPWEFGFSGKVRSCRVHDVIRELMLSNSTKEMCISVLSVVEANYIRHLSVHNRSRIVVDPENTVSFDYIRSLTVIGHWWLASVISQRMRLLRVLDLQDCTTVGSKNRLIFQRKFLHMKYLSMSCEHLHKLPNSIENLRNLETLNIRSTFHTIQIPITVVKLQHLRNLTIWSGRHHSSISKVHFELGYGMSLPRGVGNLKALRTLCHVDARESSEGTMRELAEFTRLRKLGVINLTEETEMEFCIALESLSSCLHSLAVRTARKVEGCGFLDSLSSPPLHLQSLTLGGNLRVLPRWIASLRYLAKIALSGPEIKGEWLLPLQTLPSLINLHLFAWGNKAGMQLCFHRDGFRSLKAMSLANKLFFSTAIKSLTFEKGALPNLEKLRIISAHLTQVPVGIECLASLKEIEYNDTSEEIERVMGDIVRVHPNNPRLVLKSYWFTE